MGDCGVMRAAALALMNGGVRTGAALELMAGR